MGVGIVLTGLFYGFNIAVELKNKRYQEILPVLAFGTSMKHSVVWPGIHFLILDLFYDKPIKKSQEKVTMSVQRKAEEEKKLGNVKNGDKGNGVLV